MANQNKSCNSPQSFVPWQKHLFLLIFHASCLSPKSAEWMKGKEPVTQREALIFSLWRDRLSSDGSGFDLNPFKHFAHRSNSVTVKCERTKGKHFIEWLRGENVSDNLAIFTEYSINNRNGWYSLHKLKYEAQIKECRLSGPRNQDCGSCSHKSGSRASF